METIPRVVELLLAALGGGTQIVAITKSDDTVYDPPLRYIRVAGTGDVAVLGQDDTNPVTITDVLAGETLVGSFKKIMATNTDATGIVGFR